MTDGVTGALAGEPLSKTATALVAGNGTPSHDITARSRMLPGPQFGRWRAGLSTRRLTSELAGAAPSSAMFAYNDGIFGSVSEFEGAGWDRSTRELTFTDIADGRTWNPDCFVVITSAVGGWVQGIYPVESFTDDDTIVVNGPPEANSVSDGTIFFSDFTTTGISASNLDWDPETYRLVDSLAGAPFAAFTLDDDYFWLPTSTDGGWFARYYKIKAKISDDELELEPFGPLPSTALGNNNANGYLGFGLYASPYVPLGAPTGATGNQNQFNLPAITQAESFPINQSKYQDYGFWLPPSGPMGGGVFYGRATGRCKLANLTSRPVSDTDADGQYDSMGAATISLVLDPWSCPFTSYVDGHTEGAYRQQRRTRPDWTPDTDGTHATFESDGAGGLLLVYPTRHQDTFVTGDLVHIHTTDIAGAFPSELIDGQGYWVQALTGSSSGKLALYHDFKRTLKVADTDTEGEAFATKASLGSIYQQRFDFSIRAARVALNNCACDAAADTITHASLAPRHVGDALFCTNGSTSGLLRGTTYYIIEKVDTTVAVLSETEGGTAVDITADCAAACFTYGDLSRIDLEDYCKVEIEWWIDGDGTSDNDDTGTRTRARLTLTPIGATVGAVVLWATGTRDAEVYETSLSRTLPGRSNDFTDVGTVQSGPPLLRAKSPYYNDGTYDFISFVSTKFDWGGDYDILHLNGQLYRHSVRATNGEYDYPLVSVQGADVDGQSASYRRATNTLVYRGDDTEPMGEVVFHDDARQLCAVKMLVEGEHFVRDDELTFKTYRYVRTTSFSGVAWDPVAKTLIKTGAFTNLTFAAGVKIVINTLSYSNTNILATHTAEFTPGVYEVASKDSNNQLTLVSGVGLPSAPVTAAQGGVGGHFRNDSATGSANWGFDPTPVQIYTTIFKPTHRFDAAQYVAASGTIEEVGAFADWDWYSGAEVFIRQGGGGVSADSTLVVASATDDALTLTPNPGGSNSGANTLAGQLETNIPITVDMVEIGPQITDLAARIAVTGPPAGDCEIEINTYYGELIDAGSR